MTDDKPQDVQDGAIGLYSDEDVGNRHILEVPVLGVGKVHLGLPQELHYHGVVRVNGPAQGVIETSFCPSLPQGHVHRVVLGVRGVMYIKVNIMSEGADEDIPLLTEGQAHKKKKKRERITPPRQYGYR